MYESVEFRIPEEYAHQFLASNTGKSSGGMVRAVTIKVSDPLYERIGQLDLMLKKREGNAFFFGWEIRRHYTSRELDTATILSLKITSTFEPAGEECGTIYDDSIACPYCGANRQQLSDLILDLHKIPKGKDIARTIADEWIVSQHLAELLIDQHTTGFELRPVHHKAYYQDNTIDLTKLESGKEALHRSKEAGYPHPTWSFWVWLNRSEQAQLNDQIQQEHLTSRQEHERKRPARPLPVYYQLIVVSKPVQLASTTRFGIDPFDEDREGHFRCPRGHVKGLNVLSELSVLRATWDRSDVAGTKDLIGSRRGLLVPTPMLLISQRLFKLLQNENIKGYKVEAAHLV